MQRLFQQQLRTLRQVQLATSILRCDSYRCLNTTVILNAIPSEKNHYEILDVRSTASTLEIREAFLKLSKELHPDINSNDPENHKKFVLLNEAYTVLSKPLTRQDYDLTMQVEKHLRQHRNHSVYRSHGYQADNPYYHYGDRVHWDGMTPPSSQSHGGDQTSSGKRLYRTFVNYYSLSAFLTFGLVAFILMSKDLLVPDLRNLRSIQKKDVDVHDFIMTSKHDGRTIHYYAVQDNENPELFKVLAVANKQSDEESNDCELEELNSASV